MIAPKTDTHEQSQYLTTVFQKGMLLKSDDNEL